MISTMTSISLSIENRYTTPNVDVFILEIEDNLAASNTETIIDEGEEHGWD